MIVWLAVLRFYLAELCSSELACKQKDSISLGSWWSTFWVNNQSPLIYGSSPVYKSRRDILVSQDRLGCLSYCQGQFLKALQIWLNFMVPSQYLNIVEVGQTVVSSFENSKLCIPLRKLNKTQCTGFRPASESIWLCETRRISTDMMLFRPSRLLSLLVERSSFFRSVKVSKPSILVMLLQLRFRIVSFLSFSMPWISQKITFISERELLCIMVSLSTSSFIVNCPMEFSPTLSKLSIPLFAISFCSKLKFIVDDCYQNSITKYKTEQLQTWRLIWQMKSTIAITKSSSKRLLNIVKCRNSKTCA